MKIQSWTKASFELTDKSYVNKDANSDESALTGYAVLAGPTIAAGGGKALIRTSEVEPKEDGFPQRTVVVEFESLERAMATYDSEGYQAALKALGSAAERDFRIVEGVG